MKRLRKAWFGGSAEAALAEAAARHAERTATLEASWNALSADVRVRLEPHRDPAVPGYVYFPLERVALFETSVSNLQPDLLASRPDLQVDENHPVSGRLGRLLTELGFVGGLLITFSTERVGFTASARTPEFQRAIQGLGDRIIAKISDGELNPNG